MNILKTKSFWISFVLTAVLISITVAYFVVPKRIIEKPENQIFIKGYFQDKTNHQLNFEKLKASTTFDLCLKLKIENFSINKDIESNFIEADKASIKVFLPTLLFKKILVKQVTFENLGLNVQRNEKGEFDIEKLISKKSNKGYKLDFSCIDIETSRYNAKLIDNYINPIQEVIIEGEKLAINYKKIISFLEINTLSDISLNKSPFEKIILNLAIKNPFDKEKIDLDSRLITSNIELEKYLPYIKTLYPEITNLKGDITAKGRISYNPSNAKSESDIELKTTGLLIEKKSIPIIKIEEDASLKIDSKISENELNINKIALLSDGIEISTDGKIEDYKTNNLNFSINTNIKNTSLQKALKLFPDFIKVQNDIILKLKKYEAKGTLDGSFRIKNAPANLFMDGDLNVNDFSLFNDETLSNGSLNFENKKMNFKTKFNLAKNESFDIKGYVNFLKEKEVNIDVKSTKANIEKAQKNLLAIQDIIGFSLGPIPEMDLKGQGDINLNISGKTSDVTLNGLFNFENGYAKYNTLFFPAQNIIGQIAFKNRKINYKNIKGNVKGNQVSLNGYHSMDGNYDTIIKVDNCDIKQAKTFIDNSPLLVVLKDSLVLIEDGKGTGDATINLFGDLKTFNSKGFVDIKDAEIYFVDYSMPCKNAKGIVEFDNQKVNFKNATGIIANSSTSVKGTIDKNMADIELESNHIDTNEALKLINTSKALIETKLVLQDIAQAQGEISGKIFLKGDFIKNPNIFDYGIFQAKEDTKAQFKYKNIPTFITIDKGQCKVTQTTFHTDSIDLKKGNSIVNIKGSVKTNPDKTLSPNLDVDIHEFELADLSELKSSNLVKQEDKSLMDNLNKIEGTFSGQAKILEDNITSNVTLDNVSAVYRPLNLPLKIPQGKLSSKNQNLKIEDIKLFIGDSIFVIRGSVNDFIKDPKVNIICSSDILPRDIQNYVNPNLINPLTVNNNLPLDIKIQSNKNKWNLFSVLKLQSNNFISYNGAKLGSSKPHSVVLDLEGQNDILTIRSAKIIDENIPGYEILFVKGNILKVGSENPEFNNLNIQTSDYLDLSFLNPILSKYSSSQFFTEGKFKTQITVNGNKNAPKIKGHLNLKGIKVPSIETSIDKAMFEFNNDSLILKESIFSIGSSVLNVTANFDNMFEVPTIAKDLKITSKYINLDEINRIIAKNKSSYNYSNSSIPSLTIQNATISAEELIIKNLITSNATASFSFTPDWILTMSDFKTDTAGGSISGNMMTNTKTREINGDIKFKDMLANATSSTFLGISNEVYGNLNGHTTFSTKGLTDKELVKNLNGNASFEVTNGRLVRLGSTEYLLKAVNVIQGGVTSLNLNKVINIFSPQKTGHFDKLNVDFTIKNGVVTTNNLITKSENLNLYIAGNLDMDTNYSDLTILGRLSRKGTSFLGPMGKLSLNSFINSLPGVGSDSSSYLSSIFPHISNIPGFELNDDNYRRFVVSIEGDLYDSSSVKEFRWIK